MYQPIGNAGAALLAHLRPGKVLALMMLLVGFSTLVPGTVQAATLLAHMQTKGATTTSGGTSITVAISPTTAASTLIVGVNSGSGTITSVTDNKSDIFVPAVTMVMSGGEVYAIYYAKNVLAGATTVTINFPFSSADAIVSEYQGLDLSAPLDVTASKDDGYNSGNSYTSGNTAVTTQAAELAWGFSGNKYSPLPVWTAGANWTGRVTAGVSFVQDQFLSVQGAYATTGTFTGATGGYEMGSLIATFKVASGTAPPADTIPPTVSVTAPSAGTTLIGTVSLTATAADNVAVASVQFKLDGASIGAAVTTAPYSISWNSTTASNAAHTLTAVATDTSGNATISSGIAVTVANTAPVISSFIATPASIVNGNSSTLSWTVSGSPAPTLSISGGVGTVTGTTSKVVSPTTTTIYTLTATNSNGTVTSQATVTVTAETTPPTVSITSPTGGSTVSGTVTLMANAADNVAVASVQFKLDGVNLGSADTAAPYTLSWDTTTATNTTHSLTAVATDTSNNSATSSAVSVTVTNPKPTINSFTANPSAINSGSSSTLTWSVTSALTLSISGGVGTVSGTSVSVSPTTTTTYTLTATNNAGSSTAQTTINVTPPLTAGAVNIILDDDLADDTDDAGDMALLWQLTKRGESNVLAVIISSTNSYSAPAAAAIAKYYNHAATPIGAYQGNTPNSFSSTFSYYTQQVAAQFGDPTKTRTNFPDSTTVYRQALAAAPDNSVYIVVGGFYEPLMALLNSPADSISPLTGTQLISKKVAGLIPAAGWFPNSGGSGTSNFAFDGTAASYVFANWPTAIVSVGNEVGGTTITGPASNADPNTNPIKLAYNLFCSNGRYCPNMVGAWTQAAILYAVRGLGTTFVFSGSNGNTTVNASTGANAWTQTPANQRYYIEKTISDSTLANIINPLIQAAP